MAALVHYISSAGERRVRLFPSANTWDATDAIIADGGTPLRAQTVATVGAPAEDLGPRTQPMVYQPEPASLAGPSATCPPPMLGPEIESDYPTTPAGWAAQSLLAATALVCLIALAAGWELGHMVLSGLRKLLALAWSLS
jgi:hypothetical protein